MGRPKRDTVDYFFHYVKYTQTMEIIDNKYGNDGKAAWWLLLETLGSTAGHALYKNNIMKWELFVSKTHLQENLVIEILDTFSRLGAIDLDLWKSGIIWSQNFVDGIEGVYVKRKSEKPQKPVTVTETIVTGTETQISVPESAQSIGEYSKVEDSIVNNTKVLSRPNSKQHEFDTEGNRIYVSKNGKYKYTKFDAEMAKLLSDLMTENYPNHKKETNQILGNWANQCRLMRTAKRDLRAKEDIERLIRWCQADSFWHDKIESIGKFRTQFEKLDMASQKKQSNPAAIQEADPNYDADASNPRYNKFS